MNYQITAFDRGGYIIEFRNFDNSDETKMMDYVTFLVIHKPGVWTVEVKKFQWKEADATNPRPSRFAQED